MSSTEKPGAGAFGSWTPRRRTSDARSNPPTARATTVGRGCGTTICAFATDAPPTVSARPTANPASAGDFFAIHPRHVPSADLCLGVPTPLPPPAIQPLGPASIASTLPARVALETLVKLGGVQAPCSLLTNMALDCPEDQVSFR